MKKKISKNAGSGEGTTRLIISDKLVVAMRKSCCSDVFKDMRF